LSPWESSAGLAEALPIDTGAGFSVTFITRYDSETINYMVL
jgi:hypothetical protein